MHRDKTNTHCSMYVTHVFCSIVHWNKGEGFMTSASR